MPITVDYTLTPYRITIPKSDLTLDSGTKYNLLVDTFWNLLSDYSDNSGSMTFPVLYSRIAATSSTPSITEINGAFYDLQFEDGLYSVNVISGNTNIRDVEVKNQVSVNTNNTTGFIDPTYLEYSTFDGAVWVDSTSLRVGTSYPNGTPSRPVNNVTDAIAIANFRGFEVIHIKGTYVFDPADVVDGFIIKGISSSKTTLVLTAAASISNCIFRETTLTGQMDGGNDASFCVIGELNYLDGSLLDCLLTSTVTLNGAQANFLRCASAVAGGGAGQTPTINLGGSGTNLVIRDYQGGVTLTNHSGPVDDVSIDISSGRVVLDPSITSGNYSIRGIGEVEDNSTGTAVVHNDTLDSHVLNRIDAELQTIEGGMNHSEVMRILLAAMAGKVSGAATNTVSFRDVADTKNRILATVDSNGNRTATVLDAI